MQPEIGVRLFISYAHADQELRKKLEEHLNPLTHSGKITIWQDQEIPAGASWEDQINTHLNEADLILLLVSASFIASKYCWNKEVQMALERHKAGTVRVIPIILKPALWEDTPLGQLQALPTGAKPVTQWNDLDTALEDVARGIRKVIIAHWHFIGAGKNMPKPVHWKPSGLKFGWFKKEGNEHPLLQRIHVSTKYRYCGFCSGLLPKGNYKFCGYCGQPISQGTTQVYPNSLTVPASPLLPIQVSLANQEKEQAYKSLCQQYKSESVIVVRTEDDQIGKDVCLLKEGLWQSSDPPEQSVYTTTRPVRWLSISNQTIPVAIFKSTRAESWLPPGGYMIWISEKPSRRISVINKKVTFVDLR